MQYYLYSKKENGFFTDINAAPADAVKISEELWAQLLKGQDAGQLITSDQNGYPVLTDPAKPTHDELIAMAEATRKFNINEANSYINGKQWPSRLALGRLSASEKSQLNLWLDYLDALEAVDISSAPDIAWPEQPAI